MEEVIKNKIAELLIDKTDWKLTKFGEVAIQQKKTVDRENTSLTRYVKGEHMGSEDLHLREWGELTDEYLGPAFIRYFEKDDILYGSRRTYLRKVVIAPFEGITSNTTFVIKANEKKIDKRLLPFIMMTDDFTEHSVRNSKGSVNPYINWKDISEYEFLLPPKDQQAQLAELLWTMDEVIERDISVLDNLNKIYLSKIEKQLINKNNKKIYFKDLGKVIRGVGYKPEDLLDDYNDDNCIILRSNNIFESNINFNDIKILSIKNVKKEQVLIDGDFAICMSNGSKELVGKSALYYTTGKNVSIGSFCAGFRPNSILSRDLIEQLFASESYRQAIKRILSGSAINNLKPSDIEEMGLRIESDRTKLLALLSDLKSISNNVKQLKLKISSSQSLQKSLINQVF